jgi:hypothetical protein
MSQRRADKIRRREHRKAKKRPQNPAMPTLLKPLTPAELAQSFRVITP